MVSFRGRLVKGMIDRGIAVSYDVDDTPYDAVLVIGGTHELAGLWRAKRRGVPVVQRLDGINWIHRKRRTGWRHFLRAEYGNLVLSLIRGHLADKIIYQSEFSHQWWERIYGKRQTPWRVVLNGVDLEGYTPDGPGELPNEFVRILLVEGTLGGGYELGLQTAVQMGERLHSLYSRQVEVMVVGRVSESIRQAWTDCVGVRVSFVGQVPIERIPEMDRSAHVLYAADLHPACPNSVIEALACGLPVAGFNTGALAEIVTDGSGKIVPYGGDPWNLDAPDIDGLAGAVNLILTDQSGFRKAARKRAEQAFGLDRMVQAYLEVLNQ